MALFTLGPATAWAGNLRARIDNLGLKLQTDRSYKIRLLAARKLGRLSEGSAHANPRAVRALMLGLEDRNPLVRAMSAKGLGGHHAADASAVLKQLARHDPARAVRQQARKAAKRIKAPPRVALKPQARPLGITLGTISVRDGPLLDSRRAAALQTRLSRAVRRRILAHRTRSTGRAAPELRIDVRIERQATRRAEVRFEVRVVLLELPTAHLRHAAKAVAHAKPRGNEASGLEERVALEAVNRAVDDVLATAIASR